MPTQGMEAWAVCAMFATIAIAVAAYYSLNAWFAHRERMAKIERGIDPDQPMNRQPLQPLSDRVKQLAGDPARKIEAIKVYREETGAGLAEAKNAVESFLSSL
ncbi:MAG TPA: ribosomal protein L7/L12 [Gemmataceae bacterium]|nr:ribosomal protein L7/L12 [Gemmataceae bacterium]